MVDITKCKVCKAKITVLTVDSFLLCSPACKEAYEVIKQERDIAYTKMHDSKISKEKTPGEIRAMRCGAPTAETPRTKPKGKRQCGKCGGSGHNARTCSAGGGTSGAVKGATPLGLTKKKRSLNTCGKCGDKGHNARTCGKKRKA